MRMVAVLSVGQFRNVDITERKMEAMVPMYKKVREMAKCSPIVKPKR